MWKLIFSCHKHVQVHAMGKQLYQETVYIQNFLKQSYITSNDNPVKFGRSLKQSLDTSIPASTGLSHGDVFIQLLAFWSTGTSFAQPPFRSCNSTFHYNPLLYYVACWARWWVLISVGWNRQCLAYVALWMMDRDLNAFQNQTITKKVNLGYRLAIIWVGIFTKGTCHGIRTLFVLYILTNQLPYSMVIV